MAVGPRSEVHVLLPQDHQIRIFASNGDFLGEIGREGDGPGEFRNPSGLGFIGDTLWVLDVGARRASFFVEGSLLRVESYPVLDGLHDERRGSVSAVLAGLSLLVATDIRLPFQPEVTTTPGLLYRYMDGRFDTLATVDVDQWVDT